MSHSVPDRHKAKGPKRMLALDGGGVRGILTLGYLKHIETLLRNRYGHKDLVLSDYYDFIGGTSTGAIIASLLSIGKDIDTLIDLYKDLAKEIFKKSWKRGVFFPKFDSTGLEKALDAHLGEITFESEEIKTGLMIMLKRWDTGSPWVLHNIRGNRYYEKYTREYAVKQIVRASTAAPSYFQPEKIEVKRGETGAFVDGGVTPHNNPSLQMFMLASLKGFGLGWKLGSKSISLTSVGTGSKETKYDPDSWQVNTSAVNAVSSLKLMMDDADSLNRALLQWMSNSPTAEKIDSEIGDLSEDLITPNPLLHYVRYNIHLELEALKQIGITNLNQKTIESIQKMENAENVDLLLDIGIHAAEAQIDTSHFPSTFDIR